MQAWLGTGSVHSKALLQGLRSASRLEGEIGRYWCLVGGVHANSISSLKAALSCSQIFMKYGRQRWKLKGRIEVNGKQVWDSEEMVFLPLITEFLSIKVQGTPGAKGQAGLGVDLDWVHHVSLPWAKVMQVCKAGTHPLEWAGKQLSS